ncbi:iron-sulfur cluster assembly scaffold protein [Desulfococcaceae bacterium HSG8]|nr:iron-sulfur cluster assembly scaffold protein [Desulfococcaceae bacterium HSG8]
MEKEDFDFLQEHSLKFLEMAFRTDRHERMAHPDGYGKKTGVCGDTVEIFLSVRNEHLDSVSFEVNGCMNTNACANTIAHLAEGKTLEEAWEITPEKVAEYLETLPPDHIHCSELVAGAFYLALTNHRELKQKPWKKLYQ